MTSLQAPSPTSQHGPPRSNTGAAADTLRGWCRQLSNDTTTKLSDNDWAMLAVLERMIPQSRAEQTAREYLEEKRRVRSGLGSLEPTNTSDGVAGPKPTSNALQKVTVLGESSTLIRRASETEAARVIVRLGFLTGHEVSAERAQMLATTLVKAGWTSAEIDYADASIPANKELLQTISYERTIGPRVFAEAKETPEVMQGRLWGRDEALKYAQGLGGAWSKYFSDHFEAVRVGKETKFRFFKGPGLGTV